MATTMQVPEPPTSRIILLTNVHFKATNYEIKALFQGFEIESLFRTHNVKTGRKSIAYILFSTVAEKNQACAMTGLWIRDREINVHPASPNSNYQLNDDGTAFITPKKTTTTAAEVEYKSPTINDTNFPALGAPRAPQAQKSPKEPTGVAQTGPSAVNSKTEADTEPVEADAELAVGTSSLSLDPTRDEEIVGAAAVETDPAAPQSDTSTALAVEGDNHSSRESSPKEKSYPLFKAGDHIPPPPTTFENFNLAGNDANNPTQSFPTATGWYKFQNDQFAKVEQEHREKGTNASRINNSKIEDDDDEDDDVLLGAE